MSHPHIRALLCLLLAAPMSMTAACSGNDNAESNNSSTLFTCDLQCEPSAPVCIGTILVTYKDATPTSDCVCTETQSRTDCADTQQLCDPDNPACVDADDMTPNNSDANSDTNSDANSDTNSDANNNTPDMGPDPGPCDGGEINACGGCEELSGAPGDECGTCGSLVCDGTDALECECGADPLCNDEGGACNCAPNAVGDGSGACECADDYLELEGENRCAAPLEEINSVINRAGASASFRCESAVCPAGQVAVAGGYDFTMNDPANEFVNTNMHDLFNADPALRERTWVVCGNTPMNLTVTVTCAKANVAITTVEERSTFAPGASECVTAQCPDGTRLLGGGSSANPGFMPDKSGPTDDGKGYRVCGMTNANDREILAVARCADVNTRRERSMHTYSSMAPCATSTCNADEVVLGGGGNWPGHFNNFVNSRSSESAFSLCAFPRDPNNAAGSFRTDAICYKK